MKSKFFTVLLTAASAMGFAAEPIVSTNELPLEVKQSLVNAKTANHELVNVKVTRDWFGYMRMGLADSRPDAKRVLPGLGLGVRYALPVGAIDVSASYTGSDAYAAEANSYFYTLPRVSYFYYTSPTREQSFYGGAGLAYGGLKTTATTTFSGIIPSVSLGYEMNRLQNWRSFVQLDVSQPALSTSSAKPFMSLASLNLGPVAEFSVGFGY